MESNNTVTDLQIFKVICEYLTLEEFQSAQHDYLGAHMGRFEETEENKLEYTTIHEGYIFILEEIIFAKIKTEYSDD